MGLLSTAARTVADWVKLGYPESVAKRIVSGDLPMDRASRLKRAEEQGYDTSRPVYHGTDTDFVEFDPERSPGDQYWSTTNREAVERGEVGAAGHGVVKEMYHSIQNPAGWDEYEDLFTDQIKGKGHDGLKLPDPDGHATMVAYDPKQYKSTDAAFDPQYTGRNMLGGVALPATAGLLALAQSEDADAGFVSKGGKTLLEAWHGSPHKFDKFSMDAIGTGEGAQAYGHGLYFADSEDVARNYRDMLSSSSEEMETAVWALGRMGNDREAAIKALETGEGLSMAGPQSLFDDAAKLLREEADLSGPGALYRTEIDVTPESLLDWDKPLSEQSEAVREGLMSTPYYQELRADMLANADQYVDDVDKILSESTYDDIVDFASNYAGGRPDVFSDQLSRNNVKGIKYLDGDSRGAGDGTSNYVIFDDSLINIAERGAATPGMMGAVAGTAGGASLATAAANKLAAAQAVKEQGDIRAPNSSLLHDVTMGARDVQRRLEGHPASLLYPEGLVNYLEQANREERPNWATRAWSLLDFL
jgi:hypothetical protein